MRTTILLTIAALVALPFAAAAVPTTTNYDAKLHLSGDATHRGNAALVPNESFQYDLQVDGVVSQIGKRLAGSLTGTIKITYKDDDNNTVTVDEESVTLKVEGTRAPYLAQGVDGFRLTVQQTGQSGNLKNFVIPGAFTTGVSEDDNGTKEYAIADQGAGQAQFKDTQHWQLDVVGSLSLDPQ